MRKLPKILVIVGPTASGKTALSLELAKKYNGEIVNADSRQVYRGMDIGTAKIKFGGGGFIVDGVRHHLIDVVEPDEEFTLAHYKNAARDAVNDILSRGKLPIVVGGTGLYIQAIVENLDIPAIAPDLELRAKLKNMNVGEVADMLKEIDPEAYNRVDQKNLRRIIRALEIATSKKGRPVQMAGKLAPEYEVLQIGIKVSREELIERIDRRVNEQIEQGLVEEVSGLAKKYPWNLPAMSGIGYKQIGFYMNGKMSLLEAIELIKRDTRRYAKRQMTWFKRDESIHWLKDAEEADNLIAEFLKK